MAAFVPLLAFGFSINLLTLLALVLSIGLVVDDAIVVLENIQRRADLGEPPPWRRCAARARWFAVMATTRCWSRCSCRSVPAGQQRPPVPRTGGGAGGAVAISAFVALSLTPMMCRCWCARIQQSQARRQRVDGSTLRALSSGYRRTARALHRRFRWRSAWRCWWRCCSTFGLFKLVPRELAPNEDRGSFSVNVTGSGRRGLRLHRRPDAEGRSRR